MVVVRSGSFQSGSFQLQLCRLQDLSDGLFALVSWFTFYCDYFVIERELLGVCSSVNYECLSTGGEWI